MTRKDSLFHVHRIRPEFRATWIDSLRSGLSGYATIESVDDPEAGTIVYVVGNHGYFTITTNDSLPLWMFPSCCTVKDDGQDMVNLEERIHRILDEMRVAFTPEYIERYEKSRWTKFFRLFGWEHVGSNDFAHRQKKEIVEGGFESKPIPQYDHNYTRCKPEMKESWPEIFRQRLEGQATFQCKSALPQTIVSPNGKYIIETPTRYEIKVGEDHFYLHSQAINDVHLIRLHGGLFGMRGDRAKKCASIIDIINDTLREISFEK